MSGPIVRTGTTPEFWRNWDQAFGTKKKTEGETKKKTASGRSDAGSKAAAGKAPKKTAKKKSAKKKK